MREAMTIELHDPSILIDTDHGGGIYYEFGEVSYELSYKLSNWLCRILKIQYVGVDFDFNDLRVEKVPQSPECKVNKLFAEVLGPGLLEINMFCEELGSKNPATWTDRITYSGSFSVLWRDE